MDYHLTSSSTEEGEIVDYKVPYYRSHLYYYYLPEFIGSNTVPRFSKLQNICTIKEELEK